MLNPTILKPQDVLYTIYKYAELDSTSTYLKTHIELFDDYAIIWAENQRGGRGRFTRKWFAINEKDLTFSILLPLSSLQSSHWQNITQVAALTLSETLEDYSITALIKWPNDLLVNTKKICGILCETIKYNSLDFAVLGIGLNVNSTAKHISRIDQPATSLFCELHHELKRDEILFNFIDRFLHSFSSLTQFGFHRFLNKIRNRMYYGKKKVVMVAGEEKYCGKVLGLNEDGTLQFLCEDGSIKNICSGELPYTSL